MEIVGSCIYEVGIGGEIVGSRATKNSVYLIAKNNIIFNNRTTTSSNRFVTTRIAAPAYTVSINSIVVYIIIRIRTDAVHVIDHKIVESNIASSYTQ